MSLRSNADQLVVLSVTGEISAPGWRDAYRVGFDGVARVLPGSGGIAYNVRVGDPAFGWVGDHIEPAVSMKNMDAKANSALNNFACVGNEAVVVSGDAKGARGCVTGTHGGIEHVIVDFTPDVLEKMVVGDRILIRACGQGLALDDHPDIRVMNTAPRLLQAMGLEESGGAVKVPVRAVVPPELMGSGIGAPSAERGDYDITTQDPDHIRDLGLEGLRLGDIVAIQNRSSFYGRFYRRGAVEIGVIVHSDSFQSGHGPGVTTLLTANGGQLQPAVTAGANIATYLNLRSDL